MAEPTLALELSRVSARYDAHGRAETALADVSLTVASGEILMILGPNGAGKSTLLRVLAGTLEPAGGEARLFARSLRTLARRDVARDVAFVAQSEEVRFAFSVRHVVLMGRAPHQEGWMRPSPEDDRVVGAVLERLDLEALADRPVEELSGGEKKRVAIARALAQAPRVLLLDEPTAFLDVRHQVLLFAELEQARARGTACVVVTHDLQLAAAHATRAALLKAGRLVATGPVDEVLTEPQLEATFDWPIEVGRAVRGRSHRDSRFRSRRTRTRISGREKNSLRTALIDGQHRPGV